MRIETPNRSHEQGGSLLAYLILMMIVLSAIGGVISYVSGTVNIAHRRNEMIAAQKSAEGGAVIACDDLNGVITNKAITFPSSLSTKGYALNSSLSTSEMKVYQRIVTAPFAGQSVNAQIWVANTPSPPSARIVATATTGRVTQQATVNVKMAWAYPGAVISVNPGTKDTGLDAGTAKKGNVVVNGDKSGPIVVDGGEGKAILANGRANVDNYATVPKSSISMTNYGTADQIPDYTAQGTANTLFDFNRFIAAADSTSNILNTATGNNHFTNLASFLQANALAAATPAKALEGVIVVDIKETDKKKDVGIDVLADPTKYVGTPYLPASNPQSYGITVKGTLFFNFGPAYGPLDKIFNRMPMNINPADLSGFIATDPSTYPSGYPAVYYDPTKNPTNVNISSKGFANFTADEDLPAVLYSIGTVDMHGPVNISGVVYTPSYSEIENKANEGFKVANQLQYIKGSVIVGLGIYFENVQSARSVISFDKNTLDSLATLGNAGKQVQVTYWQ